jgi:hypothetical protein
MTEALWTADRSGLAPPACNQIAYSLANRAAEQEMFSSFWRASRLGGWGWGLPRGFKNIRSTRISCML